MFENPDKSEIDAFLRRIAHRRHPRAVRDARAAEPQRGQGAAEVWLSHRAGESRRPPKSSASVPGRIWNRRSQGAGPIDVVDVFRRPEHVAAIVDDCIRLKVPALWLQEGVIDEAAAQKARDAGIFTVMNRCMFRDRSALGPDLLSAANYRQAAPACTGPEQARRARPPSRRHRTAGTCTLTRLISRMSFQSAPCARRDRGCGSRADWSLRSRARCRGA